MGDVSLQIDADTAKAVRGLVKLASQTQQLEQGTRRAGRGARSMGASISKAIQDGAALQQLVAMVNRLRDAMKEGADMAVEMGRQMSVLAALERSTPEAVFARWSGVANRQGISVGEVGEAARAAQSRLGVSPTARRVVEEVSPMIFTGDVTGMEGGSALGDIVKRRGFEGGDVRGAANVLYEMARRSKATVSEAGAAYSEPGVVMTRAGLPFTESAALFSMAEEGAAETRRSRSSARNFVMRILAPTEGKQAELLAGVGITKGMGIRERMRRMAPLASDIGAMKTAFGEETAAVGMWMLSNQDRLDEIQAGYDVAFRDPRSRANVEAERQRTQSPSRKLAADRNRRQNAQKAAAMGAAGVSGATEGYTGTVEELTARMGLGTTLGQYGAWVGPGPALYLAGRAMQEVDKYRRNSIWNQMNQNQRRRALEYYGAEYYGDLTLQQMQQFESKVRREGREVGKRTAQALKTSRG